MLSGSTTVTAQSQLYGFETNARYHFYGLGRLHADILGGFRFLYLTETLAIQDQFQPLPGSTTPFLGVQASPPATVADLDRFHCTNQFAGLQLGSRLRWEEDLFFISVFGKVAVGATDQRTSIDGVSTLSSPTGLQVVQGGILALPSNIGQHNQNVFSVVPEAGVTFGIELTSYLRLVAGYSFLYWSAVARPGAEIDPRINLSQVPTSRFFGTTTAGPAAPLFLGTQTSFWVQALRCGFEFHY